MLFTTNASWKHFAGQNDVQSALHIPMVYESVPSSPAQWEYHVVDLDLREKQALTAAELNELGKQGWLLVSVMEERVSNEGVRVHYYFVRPQAAISEKE